MTGFPTFYEFIKHQYFKIFWEGRCWKGFYETPIVVRKDRAEIEKIEIYPVFPKYHFKIMEKLAMVCTMSGAPSALR